MSVRATPQKELAGGFVVVPNVAANFSTVDTFVRQVVVNNTTASPVLFTLKDKQATPVTIVNVNVPATPAAPTVIDFDNFALFKGGVNWVAGSSNALFAEISGFKAGS